MSTTILINTFPNSPWSEHIYLDKDGNYNVATFKGASIKADDPLFLSPAGDQ